MVGAARHARRAPDDGLGVETRAARGRVSARSGARARRTLGGSLAAPIEGEACALLREALVAATADQRARLAGQCGIAFRNASNTRSDHQRRYRVTSASAWSRV